MRRLFLLLLALALTGCGRVWNDPYPAAERGKNILYGAFTERPKHLDPARSYSEDEIVFTDQIYEAPLQYAYLMRPYKVIPDTAVAVPKPRLFDAEGRQLPDNADAASVAYSDYLIRIKPGIRYQPHPAFAKQPDGRYVYRHLTRADLAHVTKLSDFRRTGTRDLTAADYIYEIKRLADPRLHSPIFGLMSQHIVGLGKLGATLQDYLRKLPPGHRHDWLDLRRFPLAGVKLLGRYSYRIRIKGKYPQFLYWLTMPFFAPIPWEADRFYSQPGMADKNLTLDWYPVGTGPYMLTENNPNARMVLTRNPNFHGERYPCTGMPGDTAAGLLADCGKPLPFIDKAVFTREKEQIPYWTKFLEGYYDTSGISSDNFDQAVHISGQGQATLTPKMRAQGIRLLTSVSASTFYMGFNMLDPVVGGESERARDLRQAISIAINQEEFISIFLNGRGIPAQGPIPPGIFGYRKGKAGIDPEVYRWVDGKAQRRSIADAKRLLAKAGYPNGRDAKTGRPLVLYFDTTAGGVGDKARTDWLTKQFQKIDVQLVVRSTDYNRFQDKIAKGTEQLFYYGWNADYPDPENFLFLLYGPEGRVKYQGENAANYENPEYDKLFVKMRAMPNGPARQRVIDRMLVILHQDSPWVWGFYPKDYRLHHQWLTNLKPNAVANNTLKYLRLDPALREKLRAQWNQPVLWPLALLALLILAVALPAWLAYRRHERARAGAK